MMQTTNRIPKHSVTIYRNGQETYHSAYHRLDDAVAVAKRLNARHGETVNVYQLGLGDRSPLFMFI